ncbi:MAG: DEAD/DEAH box helicase [Mariprofundaceae bacterium]
MSTNEGDRSTFTGLNLIPPLLKVLESVGYETPTPIQEQTIPLLLQGRDVLGQAQTGTGKTAAFALPLLSHIDLLKKHPQIMVLAPTRELAIQVSEAFQKYACYMKGFHVLPIYGGQSYEIQLRQLKRGVHVVVGTPGRVMDHMRRGTLKLNGLQALVLDEADEMLRMGFIDDVQWILEQRPEHCQIALFSATIPPVIRKIATQHLNNPEQIIIKVKEATAETIRQRYWMVSARHKLDALTRILEAEAFEAVLIFVRTKTATVELAEKLTARGYAATALNGDVIQKQREATINSLKKGNLDILVATDVAARGLDVDRISHVINFDVPHDTESYVHRIGRTGRAGREGDAILLVSPREERMLYAIERATRKRIDKFEMPTTSAINDRRIAEFKQRITETLESGKGLKLFADIVEQYRQEQNVSSTELAAALAKMVQGEMPLLLQDEPKHKSRHEHAESYHSDEPPPKKGMERYRLEVGKAHGVKPGNIVGAIINEIGLESDFIEHVQIMDGHSTVDLPEGMPRALLSSLRKVWVCGQQLNASPFRSESSVARRPKKRFKAAAGDRRPRRSNKGRGRPGAGSDRKPPRRKVKKQKGK